MITIGNNLEYRHFSYFLAVASELHFGKAAQKLFISQPGLSRQIKHLEETLGVVLFERTNRKVRLSLAGVYLQKHLQSNMQQLNHILSQTKQIYAGVEGTLRFGYVGSAMQNLIPNTLKKYRESHPNVYLNLKEMDNNTQVEALLKDELDIGFVRLEEVPKELLIKPVFTDTFSLVIPKNHPLLKAGIEDLSLLKNEDFIMFDPSYSPTYYQQIMAIFEHSGFTPHTMHKTVNASTIFKLVENNFGVSIVPTSLQHGYAMNVDFIELKNIPQRTTLSAVWRKKNTNTLLSSLLELI